MGRQVRRVPVDFDWPVNEIWGGFLMPDKFDEDPCPSCYALDYLGNQRSGTGETAAAKWVHAALYLIGMMADDIRAQSFEGTEHQFTQFGDDRSKLHPYLATLQGVNVYEHRRPSADIIDLVAGITGRDNAVSFGTGSDFAWKGRAALQSAAGLSEDWGTCPTCKGHGSIEKYVGQRAEGEAWSEEDHDPPTGEGWQLWETVSEGSPISPVFDSPEGLAQWMSSPAYCMGISQPMEYEAALRFVVGDGWAPSMVLTSSGVVPGEQWVATRDNDPSTPC